jgi:centrosomal protein POC5
VEENNRSKTNMQENLKKAFMRGVCSLNFEAMNILQPSESPSMADPSQSMGGIQQPTM